MSPENTQKLIDIYPELFTDIPNNRPMHLFGFECGDGWFPMLKDLISNIKTISEKKQFQPKACQVKEKYGALRFYLESYTDDLDQLIQDAEEASEKICENCSKPGKITSFNGWYQCRCQECLNI